VWVTTYNTPSYIKVNQVLDMRLMKNVTFQFHAALSSLDQNKMTYIFEQSPSGLGFSARMRAARRTHEGLACVAHPAFLDEKAAWPAFHSIRREYKMYEGPKEI
jgi:hypothetical protein